MMSAQSKILDSIRIDGKHLVLISENRINFIPDISDEDMNQVLLQERSEMEKISANKAGESVQLGPSIAFMPTFDCNLRCIYCYSKGGDDKESLSFATAKKAIDWISSRFENNHEFPLTVYFVGGGEPFMNFRVMQEICTYARQHFCGVEIVIVSNGVHSRRDRQWLIDNKASVRISHDGVMHSKNRPLKKSGSSVEIVEETIRELVKAKVPITVQLTVTREGVSRMIESIQRIASLGVRYIKIEPVHDSVLSRGEDSLIPQLDDFVEMFVSSLRWIAENDIPVKIDNSFISRPTSGYYCGAGEGSNLTVTPSGLITSCLEVAKEDDIFADVMLYGSCNEGDGVVIDQEKRKFLDLLHWRNYEYCPSCNLKLICGGGCPMQGGWDNNNLLEPSGYICRAHKLILPEIFKLIFENPKVIDVVFDNHLVEERC